MKPLWKRFCMLILMALALLGARRPAPAQELCARAVPKGLVGISGHYTRNDGWQHAMVSQDGALTELFFNPAYGIFQSKLARFPDTLAIASYYAPLDAHRQSVIVARTNGEIHQVWFSPATGISSALLGVVDSPVDVGAFYSYDSGRQHAVVAAANGDIVEFAWLPAMGVTRTRLTNIPGANHVAGFFAKDDGHNIVIVTTTSGQVWEIFYKNPAAVGRSVIASFWDDVIDVGAFYTDDDRYRHAIVGLANGDLYEVFYHPTTGVGTVYLRNVYGLRTLGAYATTETDSWRHVITGLDNGEVWELFYSPRGGQGFGRLAYFGQTYPSGEDPSVDLANDRQQVGRTSIAGLTVGVAGSDSTLYAVSLNAGVWRADGRAPWQQLQSSPPLANSIAVDPGNSWHLAVGERNGDSRSAALNRAGIWESWDGGWSWTYTLNPRTISACSSQAVPSIAFDAQSNLYAATECGVARKLAGAADFELLAGTRGLGAITAVTAQTVGAQTWVWARTNDLLLLSRDGGAAWEQAAVPAAVGGMAITNRRSRGDTFSLAAYETSAFTIVTAAGGSMALNYEAVSRTWSLQDLKDGDGTGLGGRRFVKAYRVSQPGLPWVLLAGTAQGLMLGRIEAGSVVWKRVAEAPWGGPYTFNPPSGVHADFWDAHVTTDGTARLWLATDGGIYRVGLSEALGSAPGVSPPWTHQNQGMHTHHAHTVTLITENPTKRSKIAYATSDNDEWIRNSSSILMPEQPWRTWGRQGDSNWTDADNGSSPIALILRSPLLVHLTGFGDAVPAAAKKYAENPVAFTLYPKLHFRSAEFFHVIQTLKSEPPHPLLDVVMLARLPLSNPGDTGETILIRNRRFAENPNAAETFLSPPVWEIEDDDLPAGAQRIWASGGHDDPVFYLYTENDATGEARLFRRSGAGAGWQQLAVGAPLFAGFYVAMRGPAFVNPYDPDHLFVLTTAGVRVSRDGGVTFQDDAVLTSLLTGSGKYPLTSSYAGGNGAGVPLASRANAMATLSQVTFFRDDPRRMAAASPYTGVFYLDEACGAWQDLTPYLPRPFTPVSSVGIDHEGVYVGMEGRSLYLVRNYELAQMASFFSRDGLGGGELARLTGADGAPVSWQWVYMVWTEEDGTVVFDGWTWTDFNGVVQLPMAPPAPGGYVFHLQSYGNWSTIAPSATSLRHTF